MYDFIITKILIEGKAIQMINKEMYASIIPTFSPNVVQEVFYWLNMETIKISTIPSIISPKIYSKYNPCYINLNILMKI